MKYQKIIYPNNKWIICEKDLNIEKSRTTNYLIIAVLVGSLLFNVVNFVMLYLKR